MYESIKLKLDDVALNFMLDHPKGDVGKHLRRIGLEIMISAKAMVGVRTGKLRRSISMRQGRKSRYQYVAVGSDVSYAYMHHEGTSKHEIRAREGRIMRFNVDGRVVYARKVNHPGTKPRKYLTVPMKRAVTR